MKQTAVEWLYETIDNELVDFLESRIDVNELSVRMLNAKQQAKEMEKEQIKHAWLSAWKDSMINPLEDKYYEPEAKQYYNETYGGNK
jgi:hypothetical protein